MPARALPDEPIGPFTGRLVAALDAPPLRQALADLGALLAQPGTVTVSRTGDLVTRLPAAAWGGPFDLAVKSFARRSAWRQLAYLRRGTPARRSWEYAVDLTARGVGTPAPVAFLERWEGGQLRESHYVSRFEEGCPGFREELIRLYRHDPTCWKLMNLLQAVADAVRGLHEAGIRHGDLGNQNILLRPTGDGTWGDVQFIDLNRARIQDGPLPAVDRAFDICRLHLPSDLLRIFKEMYFGGPPPADFQALEARLRRSYAWHSRTRAWRHPIRSRRQAGGEDPAITYPAPRDIWIWDERSAQPVNVYRGRERSSLIPLRHPVQLALSTLAIAAPAWREFGKLMGQAFQAPVDLRGRVGISIAPQPLTWERERVLLHALGPQPVLARFYHHESAANWDFTAEVLRALRGAGHPVAIALVQDRRALREPASWTRFAGHVLDRMHDVAEWVQIGQAINRVKWGLWSFDEYRGLVDGVREAARGHPGLRFMGPAAIDFEYHHVAAALRHLPAGFRFDALAHHLYVDRRGGPENFQGRFSALEKFALARALARASGACADRLIVSETNWPLLDGGVYSPTGSPYLYPGQILDSPPSATETDYANYMIRYLLIALCSGLVERVYWWRLVAQGFGLVDDRDPAAWRPRPAYHALQQFLRTVGESTFTGRTIDGAYSFTGPGRPLVQISIKDGAPVYS